MKKRNGVSLIILFSSVISFSGCQNGTIPSGPTGNSPTDFRTVQRPVLTSDPSVSSVSTYSLPDQTLLIGHWRKVGSSSANINGEEITSYIESEVTYNQDNTFERTEHQIDFQSDNSITDEAFYGYRGTWSLVDNMLTETTLQARYSTTGPFLTKDSGWLSASDQLADKNSWPKLPYSETDNILFVNGRLFNQVLVANSSNSSIVGTWSCLRAYWSPNGSQIEFKTKTYYKSLYEYQSDGTLTSSQFTSNSPSFSATPDWEDKNHYVDNHDGTIAIQSDGGVVHFAIAGSKYLILGTKESLDGKSYRRE